MEIIGHIELVFYTEWLPYIRRYKDCGESTGIQRKIGMKWYVDEAFNSVADLIQFSLLTHTI